MRNKQYDALLFQRERRALGSESGCGCEIGSKSCTVHTDSQTPQERRVRQCELSRHDRSTSAFCVGVRPAVALTVPAPPYTLRRKTRLSGGRADSIHTRYDKRVLSVSYLVCQCELDYCSERVQISNFLSATVLSCRKTNSHHRSGRHTDKTALPCLAWRCELAFSIRIRS